MIDYIALAIGHGLMAIALLRLALREDLDSDPLVRQLKEDAAANRKAASTAARDAARRAKAGEDADQDPRAQVAERERATLRAQVAER